MKDIQSTQLKFSEVMNYIAEYLRMNDLVIVPKGKAEAERLKEQCLRRKWLTYKEIADSNIWGDIGKAAVKRRITKYLKTGEIESHEINRSKIPHKISRRAWERIGKNYGTL
ncbi:hypothetical protein NE848_05865 [Gramella jeungdoensis]|uniref:Uncharacterized protein n=1 Tax=Gramella jeungdoensis TaxID=708091 RepID=A0ABT0YZJ9_9FLAO|nr:hypothetical protein [Gramella jeungdoensis]MCM8568894.1 hypothetical protein [Gramella jeungdoensis]